MKKTRQINWKRLDNAALIFPSASTKINTYVFRYACELNEEIDPLVLLQALNKTINAFPIYNSVLKRGFFWYYLEESQIEPSVSEENLPPCSTLFLKEEKTLLYRVSYYKNRINFEVYHVLSDGTGALQFLRTMVSHYLFQKHRNTFPDAIPALDYDASNTERQSDSFRKYFSGKEKDKQKEKKVFAYRLKGSRNPENRLSLIEGVIPVKSVLSAAHDFNTTLTVFIAAILIMAIFDDMTVHARKKPVILTIPVNLRQYFPSSSARNFFSIIHAGYKFDNAAPELSMVIKRINAMFKEQLNQEKLLSRLNSLSAIERNIFARISPLILKDISLNTALKLSRRESTASLSNIGVIAMPSEFDPFIDKFSIFTSTDSLQICMCSYKDKLTVGLTTEFVGNEVQRNFFRRLASFGIPVELSFNNVEGHE